MLSCAVKGGKERCNSLLLSAFHEWHVISFASGMMVVMAPVPAARNEGQEVWAYAGGSAPTHPAPRPRSIVDCKARLATEQFTNLSIVPGMRLVLAFFVL